MQTAARLPAPPCARLQSRASARPGRECATLAVLPRAPLERRLSASRPRADRSRSRPVVAAAAGGALGLLLPAVHPAVAAAAAADAAAFTHDAYLLCLGLAGLGAGVTLLLTSRFLLSYYPSLEKRARLRPAARLYRLLTLADPVLDPVTRGLFRMSEPGDLNYGAMAALALSSALITSLVGDGGLVADKLPDLDLLCFFRYLSYTQHMVLLPMWVMAVFRFFLII